MKHLLVIQLISLRTTEHCRRREEGSSKERRRESAWIESLIRQRDTEKREREMRKVDEQRKAQGSAHSQRETE